MQGFPTIAFVAGKSGTVTVYEGDRSLPDMTTFVTLKMKDSAREEPLTKAGDEKEPAKDEL